MSNYRRDMKKQNLAQIHAPFFEELLRYEGLNQAGFHTPGHRCGRSLGEIWVETDHLALDLTEISGLDWESSLENAQDLAAEFYKADSSFFLVQGATQGILGAILGCFSPGDQVLIARNCHIAVLKAVILAGITPVYVRTDCHPEWGLPLGVNLKDLEQAIAEHPGCKGLILTNPSYQGVAGQVSRYREIVGERILVIDEAHGGYFEWCGFMDRDAYSVADIWVQGTHKILGALTQTGMAHLRAGRADPLAFRKGLDLISTTSPSFILLSALDANRRFLANQGRTLFKQNQYRAERLRMELNGNDGLRFLDAKTVEEAGYVLDPWKLTFSMNELGLSGYAVERLLAMEYGIQVEYADLYQVTCFLAPWQLPEDFVRLTDALQALTRRFVKSGKPAVSRCEEIGIPEIPPQNLTPRDAAYAPSCDVPLSRANGRISAGVIAPYPPGIPVVVPGEIIQPDVVALIESVLSLGGRVNGIDPVRRLIRCVEER